MESGSRSRTSRAGSQASIPLDVSPTEKPDDATAEKKAQIMAACANQDLGALMDLATSIHGLVNDTLRRTACTILQPPNAGPPRSLGQGPYC